MKLRFSQLSMLSFGLVLFYSGIVNAKTPAEMADLSLNDLYMMSVDENEQDYGFQFGVLLKKRKLDGYMSGTKTLSYDDVLYQPPEQRTNQNYPVVPTVISQQTLVLNFAFGIDEKSTVSISIPYIEQDTDHISIVPGYDTFNIASQGLGDIRLNYQHRVYKVNNTHVEFSLGISLPTGSIDERGDTPRAPGDQQLPYTMQLGSGTFDLPVGLNVSHLVQDYSVGLSLYANVRTGKNDRDYRLGNKFALSSWIKYEGWASLDPTLKLTYIHWQAIQGQDEEITVPGQFPYPAGITDPDNYGGQQINVSAGVDAYFGDQRANINLVLPVYYNLNGVQPKQKLGVSLQWHQQF
ncbi:hypothetical protein LP316_10465 [Thalassotalea sp. LPB0316]|uniref:hypothetical protein n=1 Tax=Thalassotalea sp. LPB0316 TaxID=2769490 RepID=UPI001866FED8|nr:hypothetical protein [Thalassotalea sp. LPB0316]QOL24753.1 hypothetical protein LP316_10465 [Thalassotalea sp. LPB0316]